MNSTEIIGYTTDGDTYCVNCYRAAAADVEASSGCDAAEFDDAPIFAGAEFDSPAHCGHCSELLDGQSLTRDGQRYVAERIAEYITDDRGDCDTLAIWSDLTDHSYSSTDLELARGCYSSIGQTYSHGTLRPVDLLEAAIDAAQALHDWIAYTPAYHRNDTSMCADLQCRMADAEQAIAAVCDPETVEDDSDEDGLWYALESIADAINEHLPPPLYYGARDGDGSDIAIQVSAED